jgi:hypothetical protein
MKTKDVKVGNHYTCTYRVGIGEPQHAEVRVSAYMPTTYRFEVWERDSQEPFYVTARQLQEIEQ